MAARAAGAATLGDGVGELLAAVGPDAGGLRGALERLDWVTALPNRAAPGFVYLAGAVGGSEVGGREVGGGAVGGGGADLAEAAGRLAGEAAEAVAQQFPPALAAGDGVAQIDRIWVTSPEPARLTGCWLDTGDWVVLPASAAFASPALDAERAATAPPRSLGLAAGTDRDAARLAGLLELIERDAAAAWWNGRARPRAFDPAATAGPAAVLADMREGARVPRATSLLSLPAAAGVQVACALSRDGDGSGGGDGGGRGLAFGLKAALTPAAAARGAIMELLQMEIALEMARHRATIGTATAGDRAALDRADLVADDWPAFAALPAAGAPIPARDLNGLVAALARAGVRVAATDLPGAPDGLSVAKVFATGLAPFPVGRPAHEAAADGAPGSRARLMG